VLADLSTAITSFTRYNFSRNSFLELYILLTSCGKVSAAAPTCIALYGPSTACPNLPSPTRRIHNDLSLVGSLYLLPLQRDHTVGGQCSVWFFTATYIPTSRMDHVDGSQMYLLFELCIHKLIILNVFLSYNAFCNRYCYNDETNDEREKVAIVRMEEHCWNKHEQWNFNLPTNLIRFSLRKCGLSSRTFLVEISMSSGICSIPVTRPHEPTICAMQADR